MNVRTTLFLLVALVVVGGAILLVNALKKDVAPPSEKDLKVFQVDEKDLAKIVIAPADGTRIALEKSATEWRMTEPVQASAQIWTTDSLVRELADLKPTAKVDADVAATGLDKPRFVVTVTTTDGKSKTLKVGKRSAVGDDLYVQVDGSKDVLVVSPTISNSLEKPYTDFRKTKLVDANSADIKQLSIRKADGSVIAAQKDGEQWKLTQPQSVPGETTEISDLTSSISSLTAAEFVDAASIPTAISPEKAAYLTITYSTEAPTTQPSTEPAGTKIVVGGYDGLLKENRFVAVGQPPIYAKVSASSFERLNKAPLDLRDRKVVDIDPATVNSIAIVKNTPATTQPATKPASHDETRIQRRKEDPTAAPATMPATAPATSEPTSQPSTEPATQPATPPSPWQLLTGPKGDADETKVTALLGDLHPLKAKKYLPPATTQPTTQPAGTYVVTINTQAAGGAKAETHVIKLTDNGGEEPLIGEYKDLRFEVERTLADKLSAEWSR